MIVTLANIDVFQAVGAGGQITTQRSGLLEEHNVVVFTQVTVIFLNFDIRVFQVSLSFILDLEDSISIKLPLFLDSI